MGKLGQNAWAGLHRLRLAITGDRAGAVAIITAVAAPVLLMIVGFAADYGYASYINQRLAKATDAATLAAVSQSAAGAAKGSYNNLARLKDYGTNIFNANVSQLPINSATFNLRVESDGSGGVIASGSYSYKAPTFFAGILGFDAIPLSGTAKTAARPPTYVNYYILVDTSQSMGLAATQTDMDALFKRTAAKNGGGCVFGCHVPGPGQAYANEDLAHNLLYGPRINLRIDAAVSAIQSIIQSASTIAGTTKNITFALYAIQLDPTTSETLHTVATSSTNYATLQSAAGTIELGNNDSSGVGDTDFHTELAKFNDTLSSSGSGASAQSPLNYVFIVTDGLSDVRGGCLDGHCTGPFNSADCLAIQSKATVGVIYTTYLPIYNNNDQSQGFVDTYNDLVKQNVDQIPVALKSCATSSDYYFQASEGPEIVAAMQTLFQRTQPVTARLTQ